jgi:hypothetical protein
MPIRRRVFGSAEAEGLGSYFESIRMALGEIIVVDGSPSDVFRRHHDMWSHFCRHEPVNRQFGFLNDKVNGIQTGVRLSRNNKIVLADDDIRYTTEDIEKIVIMLDDFEAVRPQNYFAFNNVASASSRWVENHRRAADATTEDHRQDVDATTNARLGIPARMEAARMLINRATLRTADYPGTCAFRRDIFLRAGDYDGDVLFDNEELIRHLARFGAKICYANDFFIQKRPPLFRKWLEQRPRQAYEDFALRVKTLLFASIPVALIAAGLRFGIQSMIVCLLGIFVVAFFLALLGRARGVARRFFPFHVCLFAPLWVIERSVSTYWAFYWYVRRGGYPFGDQLLSKGVGRDWVEGGKIAARQ